LVFGGERVQKLLGAARPRQFQRLVCARPQTQGLPQSQLETAESFAKEGGDGGMSPPTLSTSNNRGTPGSLKNRVQPGQHFIHQIYRHLFHGLIFILTEFI